MTPVRAIARKANTEAQNANGMTALYIAAEENADIEVVRALLEEGADPNVGNELDVTPLCIAQVKNPEMAELLKSFNGEC